MTRENIAKEYHRDFHMSRRYLSDRLRSARSDRTIFLCARVSQKVISDITFWESSTPTSIYNRKTSTASQWQRLVILLTLRSHCSLYGTHIFSSIRPRVNRRL